MLSRSPVGSALAVGEDDAEPGAVPAGGAVLFARSLSVRFSAS